jgi:hypothetical protein
MIEQNIADYIHLYISQFVYYEGGFFKIMSLEYDFCDPQHLPSYVSIMNMQSDYYIIRIQEAVPILKKLNVSRCDLWSPDEIAEVYQEFLTYQIEEQHAMKMCYSDTKMFFDSHTTLFLTKKGFDLFGLVDAGKAMDYKIALEIDPEFNKWDNV